MIQAVATEENSQAIAYTLTSTHKQHPDWQGKWTATSIETKTYDYFNINSKPIVYAVTYTFNFTGMDTSKNPPTLVNDTETITLNATKTILQKPVLRNDDEEIGPKGNKIHIQSNTHLRTD